MSSDRPSNRVAATCSAPEIDLTQCCDPEAIVVGGSDPSDMSDILRTGGRRISSVTSPVGIELIGSSAEPISSRHAKYIITAAFACCHRLILFARLSTIVLKRRETDD